MTDRLTKITQTVSSVVGILALVVSIYVAFAVKDVHVLMNSRLTELLDLTQKASKAEGVKEGLEQRP